MKKRNLLSALLATVLLSTMIMGCTPQVETKVEEVSIEKEVVEEVQIFENPEVNSAEEAIALLKEGNERFVNNELVNYDLGESKRNELVGGQNPFAVVVACADSRVSPEHLFNQGLGDLFVIRVAGNILDEAEIGSIEYAVSQLGSPLVVILGHENCGAVQTAVAKDANPEEVPTTKYIDAFLDNIEPAVEKAKESNLEGNELIEKTASINVELAVEQLLRDSDIVRESADANMVEVIGAKYLLTDGSVEWLK